MRPWRIAALSLLFLPTLLAAQAPGGTDGRVFYYPKPLARTPWQPPMKPVTRLADLYRKIWALGDAGVRVPLDIRRGDQVETVPVMSMDRYRHLRLNPTF